METRIVHLLWISLFVQVISVSSQSPQLVAEPQSQSVRAGEPVTLKCRFNGPAEHCAWLKDNELTIIEGRYQHIGKKNEGDCSIRISNVALDGDDGKWQCQYPRIGGSVAVLSKEATVTVLVKPEEPQIYYNGNLLRRGETINPSQNRLHLMCVSQRGHPAANLRWEFNRQSVPSRTVNQSVPDNEKLQTSEASLDLPFRPEELGHKEVKCVAQHPAYEGLAETFVVLQVPYPTSHVRILVNNEQANTVDMTIDEQVTLNCMADGDPTPRYRWEFQPPDTESVDQWQIIREETQNITVQSQEGRYVCIASNEQNGQRIVRSLPITVRISKETPSADLGLILGVVIAAVGALTLLFLATLVMYRKRSCLFASRKKDQLDADSETGKSDSIEKPAEETTIPPDAQYETKKSKDEEPNGKAVPPSPKENGKEKIVAPEDVKPETPI